MGLALGITSLILAAAGTYVAYEGQQYQIKAAKETARYNAKLAENEALQTEMNAREASKRASREGRKFAAAQRAAIGKSGIAEAGSPLEVLGETAGLLQLEEADRGFEAQQQAKRLRAQGAMGIFEGQNIAQGLKYQQYGTLLSGASSMASTAGTMRYNYGKKS